VPIYVIHRDPRYFYPDPEKFWPERWLQYRENPDITLDMAAFIPFSMGPSNCVGKPLAMAELRYVTTVLLTRFEMKFKEGWDVRSWEQNLKDRFTLVKGELMLEIGLRRRM
jgi:cytochrome P450